MTDNKEDVLGNAIEKKILFEALKG